MKLETFSHEAIFQALEAEWNPLLQRSHSNLIFLTFQWQRIWWEAYHPGTLHILTARDETGTLLGIAPWFVQENDGSRILRAIGCVDVTDYLDVIVAPPHRAAFLSALAKHLADQTAEIDRLHLCNVPESSPLLEEWPPILQAHGFVTTVEQQEVCPVIQLPATWDDYLSLLDKKQRHELRRKLRRAGDQVDWYIVGPGDDLAAATQAFLRLMALSSPDKAAFLGDTDNVAFFHALIPSLMAAGWLQLSFLTVAGEPAAAYLNFDYNDRIMVYNSGQDIGRFGALSAGIVLLAHTIRHAIDSGRNAFDFLRGDETYKYQMGGRDTRVFELSARQR